MRMRIARFVGELFNQAIRIYLARVAVQPRNVSLRDPRPLPFPEGNERLRMEIDAVVCGAGP
jgi:hypothetical protein